MSVSPRPKDSRRKAVWGPKATIAALLLAVLGLTSASALAAPRPAHSKPGVAGRHAQHAKLDKDLTGRAARGNPGERTSVIVTLKQGGELPAEFKKYARGGKLNIINGQVVDLPNGLLKQLANHPDIFDVHLNRPIYKHNFRTSLTIGALAVRKVYGFTGAGVGVAVVDSGITTWHDDLTTGGAGSYPYGDQRVAAFVDLVNGQTLPYDDNGHGSHVAGIIAGNGFDSNGQKAGVAPDASLVSLKVLDANGQGTIGNIIAALDWVVANKNQYNIRVVNLSVGASIHESYWTDPLTLAAKRAVDAGVVVVAAAGNLGKNALGEPQYGGITAPGNAPWVLTVGASSTMGTPNRGDDTMAGYSSRGPSFIDYSAKPDLVAPGTGTVSLATPGSLFYSTKASALIAGLVPTSYVPYLSLSGTSMAAPVVAGTVALMVQANPSLTPNAIKAILQYTAQWNASYNGLTQGAGFLNTLGAVRLASFYATAEPGQRVPVQTMWGRHILWGNHLLRRGIPRPTANAFRLGTTWGAVRSDSGDNIVWGSQCATDACDNIVWGSADDADNIVWGSECTDANCDNIVWGSSAADDNIVWGSDCDGADCDNIVWGSADAADNIVWGSADAGDNIVWGSDCADPTSCGDNIVWGSSEDGDNIVWGSAADDNIVWGSAADDNIVWGSDCDPNACDNIVWGSTADGTFFWGDTLTGAWYALGDGSAQGLTDGQLLRLMVKLATSPPPVVTTDTTTTIDSGTTVVVDSTTLTTTDTTTTITTDSTTTVTTDSTTTVTPTPLDSTTLTTTTISATPTTTDTTTTTSTTTTVVGGI